jgi:zinc transport system substrate-binding protein
MTRLVSLLSAISVSILMLGLTGCNSGSENQRQDQEELQAEEAPQTASAASGEGTLTVYTVNYPLQYFTARIGGEHVEAVFPAPPDIDPAFWSPDAATIAAYQAADLIFLNGATYAKWVAKVSLPTRKLIDTSALFADRFLEIEGAVTHSHGPGGEHAHTGTAFTTWLDFNQAAAQAGAILEALVGHNPEHGDYFRANHAALVADLAALDRDLSAVVADLPDRPLVASHPVYQYLAKRYGMNLKSVMWEPDVSPNLAQWRELDHLRESHPARWMIWEGEPLAHVRERLEAQGVRSVVFDPCGNRPAEGDFLSVMKQNVVSLRTVYSKSP